VAGDAALLVDPLDADALAAALARAVADEAERARLLAAGRARVAAYSWSSTASAMLELYRQAIDDRS
jgi:glycosyltransferase involved in cell wall biosynthesis